MSYVVSMVGISMLTNCYSKGGVSDTNYSTLRNEKLPFSEWDDYKDEIDAVFTEVSHWAAGKTTASAEIASLLKIQQKYNQKLTVRLLASDTVRSALAAKLIEHWFIQAQSGLPYPVEIEFEQTKDVIPGLDVYKEDRFRNDGLPSLFQRVKEICKDQKDQKDIILNITGGFKAVVPFLSILGQLYQLPTYYLFETEATDFDNAELIQLPKLPINFDVGKVDDYYTAFYQAAKEGGDNDQNLTLESDFWQFFDNDQDYGNERLAEFLNDQLFYSKPDNHKITLTVYGKMLYDYYGNQQELKKEKAKKGKDAGTLGGTFWELKLFEYFVRTKPEVQVQHSVSFEEWEADIFLDDEKNTVTVVECKPGGNIPFKEINNKKIAQLVPRVVAKYPDKEVHFHVYLYHHRRPLRHLEEKMQKSAEMAKAEGAKDMKWFWIHQERNSIVPISENIVEPII